MKQFAVELKRTSYITVFIDAESKEEAIVSVFDTAEYAAYDEYAASYEVFYVYDGKEKQV